MTKEENIAKINSMVESEKYFKENWNGDNAKPITEIVFERTRDIINELSDEYQPLGVFPVAKECLQIEYENEKCYLEFEIHRNVITGYVSMSNFENDKLIGFTSNDIKDYINTFLKS